MTPLIRGWSRLALLFALGTSAPATSRAADEDLLPRQLPKDQRENLARFLQQHARPKRYLPPDAKLVDVDPAQGEIKDVAGTPARPIQQFMVQIISHRPVPGQEEVRQVDVYYYRPNPETGKPGITVRHTVDVTTGKQVGATEVLLKSHTPLAREELAAAVALAEEKTPAVQALYKQGRSKVHWEYLQLFINRKHDTQEPGDRVVRLVFTTTDQDQAPPAPVAVMVNLTKGAVVSEQAAPRPKGGQ
jgi:hypothetical protein